jgi:hypothetical protein
MNDIYQEEFMNAFKRLIDETTTDALLVHDTKLEDRIDDLESLSQDHDDRIEVIDGAFTDVVDHGDRLDNIELFEERIETLENQLRQITDLDKLVERKVQEMISQNRLKLYVASPPPQ